MYVKNKEKKSLTINKNQNKKNKRHIYIYILKYLILQHVFFTRLGWKTLFIKIKFLFNQTIIEINTREIN